MTKPCKICKKEFQWYPSWKSRVTCSRSCSSSLRWPHSYPKHMYRSRFYGIWSDMKQRCYNKKSQFYYRYGGRGIKVCDDWLSFAGFYHDMQSSYTENKEIDRINNDGDYEPSNCKWSTREEQCNNRVTSRWITINNEKKTLAQWCKNSKVKASTVRQRYYVYGWSIERALGFTK